MSQLALYHQFDQPAKILTVLKRYQSGKVDVGPAGGAAVVTLAQVAKENPQPGQVTLVTAEEAALAVTKGTAVEFVPIDAPQLEVEIPLDEEPAEAASGVDAPASKPARKGK